MKNDIYQEITDQIVRALEQGVRPWMQPWNTGYLEGRVALPLRHNGVPYRGINIVVLWMAALARVTAPDLHDLRRPKREQRMSHL